MREYVIQKRTFDDLRVVTRHQLLNYPEVNFKKKLKSFIKSIIFDKNLMKVNGYFWPNGLLATSLEWCYHASEDSRDLLSLQKYYDAWISKGASIHYIDQAINGYSLIYLHQLSKNIKYKKTIDAIIEFLFLYPKAYDGCLPYRRGDSGIILVDGIGMTCPFLCRYGSVYNNPLAIELALTQLINYINKGFDDSIYLPYHGYDPVNNIKVGIIGWGRGVGWLLIGMVDSLEYIPKSNPHYNFIADSFNKTISSIVNYQNKDGCFNWQVTAKDGYTDTSATSMISYAIRRGIMIGILNCSFLNYSNLALNSLHNSTMNGLVLDCSSECKGISMYPQNYGAFPWAQGPTTALTALSIIEDGIFLDKTNTSEFRLLSNS